MIIFGVDPGTAQLGYGIIKTRPKLAHITHGVIKTSKDIAHQNRLLLLHQELRRLFKKHSPDLVAVEQLYFFKNVKSALPVSEARGVVLLLAAQEGLEVAELAPLQVKLAVTGYGKAQKRQVQRMVQEILGLKELPRPDDAADALGIAIASSVLTRRRK